MGDVLPARNDYDAQTAGLALARVVMESGLRPPTLQQVADQARTGVSTLSRWFGGKQPMLPRAAGAYAIVFWDQVADQVNMLGWPGFVSVAEQGRHHLRAWLAFEELGRADEQVGEVVAGLWDEVRTWMRYLRPGPSGSPVLDDTDLLRREITLRGLWAALCAPTEPLDATTALALWADACALSVAAGPASGAA